MIENYYKLPNINSVIITNPNCKFTRNVYILLYKPVFIKSTIARVNKRKYNNAKCKHK